MRMLALTLVAATALVGCTTELTHDKLTVDAVQEKIGFPYYLPKQKYIINVTYELVSCPDVNGTAAEKTYSLQITQTASIVESSIADESEYYVLTYQDLDSVLKTTTFNATTYDNKTLHTLGVQVIDNTAAAIKSFVGTGVGIGKMVMGLPTAAAPRSLCRPEIYDALKKVRDGKMKLYDPALDDKARAPISAAVTAGRAILQIQKSAYFVPDRSNLTTKIVLNDRDVRLWFGQDYPNIVAATEQTYRDILKRISQTEVSAAPVTASASPAPKTHSPREGVVFRDPAPATVRVCVFSCSESDPEMIATLDTQIAQFGRYMVLSLKNQPFDKNNMTLSFAPNGRLESITYGSESKLDKAAASLQDTVTQVEGMVDKKRAADQAKIDASATAELKSIKAQTDLLNAKGDRIKAQNNLNQLGGQ